MMASAGPSRHVMGSVHDTMLGDSDGKSVPAMTASGSSRAVGRPWPPRLYLAIDCGGTKSAAAICDETGHIVGRGQGGPSNYTDNGLGPFLASVEESVKNALYDLQGRYRRTAFVYDGVQVTVAGTANPAHADTEASKSESTVADALASIRPASLPSCAPALTLEAAWLGIAGVDSPTDVATLSPHVGAMLGIPYPSPRLVVANDTSLLASPIADTLRSEIKSGVVVIAGTGSIVMSFRRRKNGMLKVLGRIGGFGWLLGDEGSGYAVGRNAVRQVLDAADRERLAATRSDIKSSLLGDDDDSDSEEEEAPRDTGVGDTSATRNAPESTTNDDAHVFSFEEHKASRTNAGTGQSNGRDPRIFPLSKLPPSPPPSAGASDVGVGAQSKSNGTAKRPYGHTLRDRILQHWGLTSTDELLRAVYDDDQVTKKDSGSTLNGQAGQSSAVPGDASQLSRSDHTLKDDGVAPLAGQMEAASLLALPEAKASANLLPPSAVTLNTDTRAKATSPIPSLSSSPTGSSTAASEVESSGRSNIASASASPRFRPMGASSLHGGKSCLAGQVYHDNDVENGSMTDTEATSTSSSLGAAPHVSPMTAATGQPLKHANSTKRRIAKAERKHRLAALAPIVFHLAFTHADAMSLDILRTQAHAISLQIRDILQPGKYALAHLEPSTSVLCLGGSLVGVERYRDLIVEELAQLGVRFARLEYVGDAARRGAVALSHVLEGQRQRESQLEEAVEATSCAMQSPEKPLPAVPTAIASSRSTSADAL